MRALAVVHPAASHLDPVAPMLRELAGRGWETLVAASPRFGDTVAARGFDFHPVGLPWLESSAEDTFPELAEMPLEEQGLWWVTNIFADRAAKPAAADLMELVHSWDPDLIIRDYWEFGSWVVAEATGTPCAVAGIAMHMPGEQLAGLIGDRLQKLRAHVGLSADPGLEGLYAGPYVDLVPPSWQIQAPRDHVQLRPVPLPDPDAEPPPELADQLERPTVLVTFGTVFNRVPGVFEAVISALADEPVTVVVTTGPGRSPRDLGPLPANTHAKEFIPYAQLLPHCDAIVCHAGFGTTMWALAHDLPVVSIPLSADQPIHAARGEELGVGVRIEDDELPPERIRDAVRRTLGDRDLLDAASDLGHEIRTMTDAGQAASLLEEQVRTLP